MSLRRGYKSNGSWDSERSVFEFKDEFGQDPIMGRYGSGPGSQALAEARVARSASEVQLAQASLDAMTRPAKVMSDFFTTMNQAAEAKDNMLKRSRVSAQSIKFRERLNEANDYDSLTALRADPELAEAFEAEENSARYNAKFSGLRARGVATLQNRLPKAINTAEVDGLINEFSWLAADPEAQTLINTFAPLAEKREAAMKGLVQLGAPTMPITPQGEFDLDRAENIVGELGKTDIRTLSSAQRGLQQQLSDIDDPESPEAVALQSDLTKINRQIADVANRSDQATTRANMDLQALGGTPESVDEDYDRIFGGGAKPAAQPSQPAQGPAPAQQPVEPSNTEPVALEDKLNAATQAAESSQRPSPGSGRAKMAEDAARKRAESNRAQTLADEKQRLMSSLYQSKGRGGGGGLSDRLRPGLSADTEEVKQALARIAEIERELESR